MNSTRPNDPQLDEELESEVQDDQVIGVAFRWSAIVIVLLLIAVAVGFALRALWAPTAAPVTQEGQADLSALLQPGQGVAAPALPFRDISAAAGVEFVHRNGATGERLLPETMGGGVAWFDFDNDQRVDLLLVDSGPWPDQADYADWPGALRLYRNLDGQRFQEISAEVGLAGIKSYGMGVAVGDYDGDGDQDLFLAAVGANRLFNNQDGRFVEVTEQAGVAGEDQRWSSSAGFLDFDRDGWLDLWVVNYVEWSRERDFEVDYRLDGIGRAYGPPTNFPGTQSYLYRNLGDGRFVEVGAKMGIHVDALDGDGAVGKGLALLTQDLDGDGWVDVMVANDTVRNFVFRNRGEQGGFEEVGELWGLGYDRNGMATGAMGIDAGNLHEDGAMAIAIGNFANEMTSVYVAQAQGQQFADEAIVTGVGPASRLALSFGLLLLDLDLDGRLDLVQANGHVENDIERVQASQRYAQPAQVFWNCGADCRAQMQAIEPAALGDLGLPNVGRGLAAADFDNDGDLDLALTQVDGPVRLLRNDQSGKGHWLKLQLRGQGPNVDALGAEVVVHSGSQRQSRSLSRNRSYLSQNDLSLHFGLGANEKVDRIEIRWPNGAEQVLTDVKADQLLRVEQIDSAETGA
ncbi:CRTAC1 family protein [Pseudomarimonas arenosa]|uniref:CRTAC1 family protein n=1 Tax=Pseudomarimonas arenosa TaxID=2774145 RepID=A0AAW3ZMS7_9GAMM|nr:CRTAC1 family protein [Pseudomarimonas arenosa]MBD8526497.1 CRTAC1 family protein [Pseudomarimonas arenosa]